MELFQADVREIATANESFRSVLFTAKHSQVVVMSLLPGEEIGEEIHQVDQLFYFVRGRGEAVLDGRPSTLQEHEMLCVPAGTRHNICNTGTEAMKLFTIYAPPQHAAGTIHRTKSEALAAEALELTAT